LQVQITGVVLGKVPLKYFGGEDVSKDDLLMVRLELLNTNPNEKGRVPQLGGQEHLARS